MRVLRLYEVPPVCGIEPEVVASIRTGPYIYDYTQSRPVWQLRGRARCHVCHVTYWAFFS